MRASYIFPLSFHFPASSTTIFPVRANSPSSNCRPLPRLKALQSFQLVPPQAKTSSVADPISIVSRAIFTPQRQLGNGLGASQNQHFQHFVIGSPELDSSQTGEGSQRLSIWSLQREFHKKIKKKAETRGKVGVGFGDRYWKSWMTIKYISAPATSTLLSYPFAIHCF